jgi:hypothetical protein
MGYCAKMEPQYCGPFEILDRVGPVAYRLALPPKVKVLSPNIGSLPLNWGILY